MTFLGVRLLTTKEFLKAVGWLLSKKMFEYVRDTLHLIPRPIKVSTGKGTVAYYPEFAVPFMKKIPRNGSSTSDITKKIKERM